MQNWQDCLTVRLNEGCPFSSSESRTAREAGLREIAFFIARDNKSRARSFVRELQAKAREIGDMPRAFPLVPRYEHHGIRRRPFRDYLIFYRIEKDRVSIVHILHGARDYEALLFPRRERRG